VRGSGTSAPIRFGHIFGAYEAFVRRLGYLFRVSILETTLIFVGIPLLIVLVFGALSWPASRTAGPVPSDDPYKLGDKWDHDALLWTATDEVTAHSRAHHGHAAGTPAELIGGTASGKW